MKVSIMEDGRKILVYLSIVLILVSLGCVGETQQQTVSDFSISDFTYENRNSPVIPPIIYKEEGKILALSSIIITTSKEGFYVRIYDLIHDVEIAGSWQKSLTVGDNKFWTHDLYLDSLHQSPEIKVCISNQPNFNKDSEGVVCKIETFPSPNVELEVFPNPLIFSLKKNEIDNLYDGLPETSETFTIKNIGNVKVLFAFKLPESWRHVKGESYPNDYPRFYIFDPLDNDRPVAYIVLMPNERKEVSIGPVVKAEGEFKTSLGNFETNGVVCAIFQGPIGDCENALYTKQFKIKTTITE